MRRSCVILWLVLGSLASLAGAQSPYERIERAYRPYMAGDDPLAFPLKVSSIAADPYTFWRGSKDLFYHWCQTDCSDWLSDTKAILPNHGDLHLGNIGTYASADAWGKLAFGMVDFDDSATLPFQLELLQGLITLELTARQNQISLDDPSVAQLAQVLFDAYRISVNSRRNATNLLVDSDDPITTRLLKRAGLSYAQEVDAYTRDGRFRKIVLSEKGKLKEVLRPAMNRADEFAEALVDAINNEPDLKPLFRLSDVRAARSAIKDIVQRTRLGSSGSQGLKKYFILLDKPLRGVEHDLILYLKQEIPSAAERSGVVEMSSITPGHRVKRDMDRLTDPLPLLNSWCQVNGESYWVTFKEPWSDELDPSAIKTADDLIHAAKIWGTVTGATHRESGRFEIILPRLTPALLSQIRSQSTAFIEQLDLDFSAFRQDERVAAHRATVEAELQSWQAQR